MGKRAAYAPGTFCWVDLATTDVEAAKRFYSELLDWEYDDRPANGGVYSVARRYDVDVAAMNDQQSEERESGVPPHWNNYISTDSADETAARARDLGGSVLVEPFDIMDVGRMAVIADPTGAVFCTWEPRSHAGAGHVNDVGCPCWNELSTTDTQKASSFYSQLFGWRLEELDTGGGPAYWEIRHDGGAGGRNGGVRALAPEQAGVPPHWMPYFTVESMTAAADAAKASGGNLFFGPAEISMGRIAVIGDPQGAVFGIFEGKVDD